MPAISVRNLTKYYKALKAVDDISFEIREGDFFGFLGPNGAGKTTTISVITGLANFKAGEVRVFGYDVVADYRITRRLIGLAPQDFNFDPFLSAEQILFYEAGYFGLRPKLARARTDELLEMFDLLDRRKVSYRRLSGGQKRRLMIARALIHQPKILILDEPTAGIDVELRHEFWRFLTELNQLGTTIFLTTHYIEEAERLCNKIGVIHEGKLVSFSDRSELIRGMRADRIEVRIKETLSAVPERLKILHAELANHGRVLSFREDRSRLNEVLHEIFNGGLTVEAIDVKKTTLEDVFISLTHKRS
ncbi:MAG: ABC transporter ATP-binding protein [Candidatus Omnitrophica bacterium]|nr:ABC transporter ATP-binding protein [Candidatus Omnitrophota bacterium]